MKPKSIAVLDMCIDNGIESGWRAAHKYDDNPPETRIKEAIRDALAYQFYEWFDFEGKNDDK
jgi:hypothetical protein